MKGGIIKKAIFFVLLNIILISSFSRHFITGYGCGGPDGPISTIDKPPDSLEELKKLKCVWTSDTKGYQKWKLTKPDKCKYALKLNDYGIIQNMNVIKPKQKLSNI